MADIPAKIGKYKILGLIATGGMGDVYKAEHPTLDQLLVIKKLTMQGKTHVQKRFLREAKLMFSFKSDYIVDVYDHFAEHGAFHIVQEYIDGISLEELIDRERYLPEHIALYVLLYSARALQYAHSKGVVHRDIKPGNILISNSGSVKLVDFGIASIRDQRTDDDLTQVGMTLGTPSYMAPEQFTSSRDVDHRADIYSLGVMLYEMITGKKPYPSGKLPETYQRIIKGKYKNPRKHNPNISRFTLRTIRKCMRPKITRRYQNLHLLIKRLEKRLGIKPVIGQPFEGAGLLSDFLVGSFTPPKKRIITRPRLIGAAIVSAVGALLLGAGIYTGFHHHIFHADTHGRVSAAINSQYGRFELLRKGTTLSISPSHISQEGEQHSISFSAAFPIPRYLPSGEYVLSTTIDTKTYTKDIFVQPLSRQFERADNQDRNRFSISHQPPQPIPLRVWPQVRDLISGKDITSGSRIEVFWQDRFYPVTLMEQQLFSGQEYSFRIGQRNYYSQEYKKNTSVDQSDLILEVALIPRPGSITLSTEDNKISILLNGHDYYTAGGPRPVRLPIPDLLPGNPLVLNLPPGRYTLEAIGRRDKADIAIQVESGQNRQVMIEYDAEKEEMTIGESP